MFSKLISFLFLTFFAFSSAYAVRCPVLAGAWQCGLEGSVEFPIMITQGKNDEGITLYGIEDLTSTMIRADGVERDISEEVFSEFTDNFSSDGGVLGKYKIGCDFDGLKISGQAVVTAWDDLLAFPLSFNMTLAPWVEDGNVEVIRGNISVDMKFKYKAAKKAFATLGFDLNLSDQGTKFSCVKMPAKLPTKL